MHRIKEIAPGFFNIRAPFRVLGFINVGTHMSLLRLSTGKFLVVDTVPMSAQLVQEINHVTGGEANIEAVVGVHPFHTVYFGDFFKHFPNVPFVGTPRHVRNIKTVPWAGDIMNCDWRNKWEPDVHIRIPDGAEFASPQPEYNHFTSAFVYHKASKTMHVDDTLNYAEKVPLLFRAFMSPGQVSFHPTMKSVGILPHPSAPFEFRDWMNRLLTDWDIDNLCTAHGGIRMGGAGALIQAYVAQCEPVFQKMHQERVKKAQAGETKGKGKAKEVKVQPQQTTTTPNCG
eukprot:TRINITY_DN13289_c0_g1_i1.p1 TRINITY_DN13289_c0_g1~~TRINITY_DN13289_c0_g1_i1.p1  ORF type:complete len:286 (+),score=73.87 TRINITY_DN13289_c0_g1_i1:244-1101(+)